MPGFLNDEPSLTLTLTTVVVNGENTSQAMRPAPEGMCPTAHKPQPNPNNSIPLPNK